MEGLALGLSTRKEESDAEHAATKTKLAEAETKCANLETKCADLEAKCANLETKFADLEAKYATLDEAQDELCSMNVGLGKNFEWLRGIVMQIAAAGAEEEEAALEEARWDKITEVLHAAPFHMTNRSKEEVREVYQTREACVAMIGLD
jgi:predicted nuclease with TOPRIM domain